MKNVLLILAIGGGTLSVPALAQDIERAFTGPYVQAEVGWDKSRSGSSVDIDDTRDTKQSIDGLLYGAGVGFDAALGSNLRVGAEAEISDSTAKWDRDPAANTFNLGRVSTGRDLYVGGKVGFVASPQTMLYVKGGYTNARFNVLGTDGTNSSREHFDADGWRLGAGAEYAFGSNTFAKLEHRYSNYNEGEVDFPGDTPDSNRFDIDTDRHQVVAAVGLRF